MKYFNYMWKLELKMYMRRQQQMNIKLDNNIR